ncbi:MAG: efflux RND transporter periplasmic adaptor subunit [Firmicutes bacterium]|nr:efflux RND transporter periplasmic adaptor subunit [Bacillota bacterium]
MSFFKEKKVDYGLIIVLLTIVLIVGIAWKVFSPSKTEVSGVPLVRTQIVHIESGLQSYRYAGQVRGRYESPLAFRIGGKVIQRCVEPGSMVKRGDLLMQLDSSDVQLNVNVYESQVNSAQSQLDLAHQTLERSRSLYEQKALSKAEYDRAQSAYDAAQGTYNQAVAQSRQAMNQLDYCNLRADNGGTITNVNVEAGQVVAAGTPVLTLVQDGELEVEISVPENRIEEFRSAKQIKVSFWALPDLNVDGQIREVSPVALSTARTFNVRITLLSPPPEVKLGMTASVSAGGVGGEPAIAIIPLSAVYQTGNSPAVWLVNNETVSLKQIKIDGFDNERVKVTEGLKEGDRVVTAGVHKLLEGQKVRVGEGS